jgi:hypothetical protein
LPRFLGDVMAIAVSDTSYSVPGKFVRP